MAITRIGGANAITGVIPVANGGTGATSFAPGKILQVSNFVQTSSSQAFSSTSYADLTSVTVNITPSSTSNKILILANLQVKLNNSEGYGMQFVRGSTSIYATPQTYSIYAEGITEIQNINSFNFLDSPSSTSQQTYKVQVRSYDNETINFNTSYNSNIQVMEIAG